MCEYVIDSENIGEPRLCDARMLLQYLCRKYENK